MRHYSSRASAIRGLAGAALAALAAIACSEGAPTAPVGRIAPAFATGGRAEPTFALSTVDPPDATATFAQGIGPDGTVVGYYFTADGRMHGFVWKGDTFETIDYPGAYFTDVRGIGPDGTLVGTFAGADEEAAAYHGYRRTPQGNFEPIHYSGHLYEILQRILPDGTILGCRHDHNLGSTMRGIVITTSGASEVDAYASMNNGATPDLSRIVGGYVNQAASNRQEGYIIENGAFTPFIVPGSISTTAWDIDPRGDVVGVYRNAAGFHGFVRTGTGYTTINYPGAAATRVFGTNARGDVVGTYVVGGVTHGFLGTRL